MPDYFLKILQVWVRPVWTAVSCRWYTPVGRGEIFRLKISESTNSTICEMGVRPYGSITSTRYSSPRWVSELNRIVSRSVAGLGNTSMAGESVIGFELRGVGVIVVVERIVKRLSVQGVVVVVPLKRRHVPPLQIIVSHPVEGVVAQITIILRTCRSRREKH